MSLENDLQARTRGAGQILFVGALLVLSLVLLSQITRQTEWVDSAKSFAAQPRFWPGVALLLMTLPLALHLWRMPRRRPIRADWQEARRWLEPLEHALWFKVVGQITPRRPRPNEDRAAEPA